MTMLLLGQIIHTAIAGFLIFCAWGAVSMTIVKIYELIKESK